MLFDSVTVGIFVLLAGFIGYAIGGIRASLAREAAAVVRPLDRQERDEIVALIAAGEMTTAIRRVRELTGADLAAAHSAVTRLQHELSPRRLPESSSRGRLMIFLGVALCSPLLEASAQGPAPSALLYRGVTSFFLQPPPGWRLDSEAGKADGVLAAVYQDAVAPIIVLTARTRAELDRAYPDFERLVRSYGRGPVAMPPKSAARLDARLIVKPGRARDVTGVDAP